MAKELVFDLGVIEYTIKGIGGNYTISFNPSDSNFFRKVIDVFADLDKKQGEYEAEMAEARKKLTAEDEEDTADSKVAFSSVMDLFDIRRKWDSEMRKQIDSVFGEGASVIIFGDVDVYASADGFPIWANLLFSVIDEADESVAMQQNLSNSRIEKYTKKYKRKRK